MSDFFKGWRRKIGCVTLVMACILMGGWVRSQFVQDTLTVPIGAPVYIKLVSVSHHLIFSTLHVETDQDFQTRFWATEESSPMSWVLRFPGFVVKNPIKPPSSITGGGEHRK